MFVQQTEFQNQLRISQYVAFPGVSRVRRWKPDPNSIVADAMQRCWNQRFPYGLSHIFRSDMWNPGEGPARQGRTNEKSCTKMANSTLVSFFFGDVNTKAVTEDNFVRATVKFSEENTSFISNGNLSLAAWKVTRNPLRWKEFQGILPNLAPNLGCYCKLRIGLQ